MKKRKPIGLHHKIEKKSKYIEIGEKPAKPKKKQIIYEDDIEYEDVEYVYEDEEAYEDGVEYIYEDETTYEDDVEYEDEAEYEDDVAYEYEEEAEYEDDVEYADEVEYEDDVAYEYEEEAEYEDDVEYEDEVEYADEIEYEEDGYIYEDSAEYGDEVEYSYGVVERPVSTKSPTNKKHKKSSRGKNKKQRSNAKKIKGSKRGKSAKPTFGEKVKKWARNFTAIDAIVALTGVCVLGIAVVTVIMWNNARAEKKQVSAMMEIGEQLSSFMGMNTDELQTIAESKGTEPETEEMTTEEATTEEAAPEEIEVTVNMTSVERDLKVKFVNKATNKLISGTAFQMEQTGPDNQKKTLTDDDKDGIIYQKDLAAGNYVVKLLNVEEYTFPTEGSKVTVKDKIEYKKIDVADEVKTEKEVNTAKEDTQVNIVEESKLKDTVEFVESSKKDEGGAVSNEDSDYEKVDKSNIPNPSDISAAGYFERLVSGNELPIAVTGVQISTSHVTLTVGESTTLGATVQPDNAANKGISWSSSNSGVARADGGTVTALAAGTATITVKTTEGGHTASCEVTVKEKPPENVSVTGITLDKNNMALEIGASGKLTAAVTPGNATNKTIHFSTNNNKIVSVSDDGTVTGLAVGNATVTAKTEEGGHTASCVVVVNKVVVGVSVDRANVDLLLNTSTTVVPKPSGFKGTPKYTWASSNTKIATVDGNGKIKGLASGMATITVTATLDGNTANTTIKVTVRSSAENDTTTKLKDKAGNQLYVKMDGKYREAVYADYFTAEKFYKRLQTNNKYTGWQTIDNVTYYFDKNGNKVTGTQVIQGVQYTFGSDGAMSVGNGTMGIDVSKWNGNINWSAVKNSGVSYVIIRCGYRGSSTGALIQDSKYINNIKGAQAAGLKVGIYFFTQAVNEVEAVEEASMALNLVKGYNLSMPIYIDTEGSGGRADGIDKGTRTAVCKAFCATIQNGGHKAGVYASKSWFETKLNSSALNSYKIWLAQYAEKPTYGGKYDMWQYTSKGSIGGINGNVDLNIVY